MARARWVRLLIIVAAIAVVVIGGLALGWMITNRVETGRWELPDTEDLIRVVHRDGAPSRVIFLDGRATAVEPGDDDAARLRSSIVMHAGTATRHVPGWTGGADRWRRLVACVKALYAPFDVEVTDRQPAGDDYLRVLVGGRPGDAGIADRHVSGMAPFDGGVIPRAIVFAFAQQVGNDVQTTCETIGMETAHTYGLDHEYDCHDVMTYRPACGPKTFVDRAVPCGELRPRPCEGGAATQSSFRTLLKVLGPRR
jgi:hypothetical protein